MLGGFHLKNRIYSMIWPIFKLGDAVRLHPFRAMQIRALEDSVDYLQANMQSAIGMYNQKQVIGHGAREATKVPGAYCEFGVFKGETLRFIASIAGNERSVHGFDSFEGLPTAWAGHDMEKGAFNVGGKLPKVLPNTKLHKGWFDKTVEEWKTNFPGKLAFIHIDCDLYSSTKTIFSLLAERMQSGTVIVFDEYFNYPSWREHEFKAFQEFVKAHDVEYTYLAYAKYNVCVRIDKIGRLQEINNV